jgi:E3 ubiquitin-protein ligase TRIP12
MRPAVNSSRPQTFNHLKFKAKKERMLEERYTEIERENRILLEKMTMARKRRGHRVLTPTPKRSLNESIRRERLK